VNSTKAQVVERVFLYSELLRNLYRISSSALSFSIKDCFFFRYVFSSFFLILLTNFPFSAVRSLSSYPLSVKICEISYRHLLVLKTIWILLSFKSGTISLAS
jgi:hypothetical protein